MDERRFKLRVTFGKVGRLAMLSHLELARALERIVRRAGLPYAISQGFSPHMRIAFGAALPVGVGGTCEIFDVQLTRYIAPQKALEALQKATVDDLPMLSCAYIENSAPAASVAFPKGTYRVVLSDSIDHLVVPPEITVVRKKKEKVLAVADYLIGDVSVDGSSCTFELQSLATGSLRADVFIRACLEATFAHAGSTSDGAEEKASEGQADIAPDGQCAASGGAATVRVLSITRIAQRA